MTGGGAMPPEGGADTLASGQTLRDRYGNEFTLADRRTDRQHLGRVTDGWRVHTVGDVDHPHRWFISDDYLAHCKLVREADRVS